MFQDFLFFGVDTKVFYSYRMLHLSHLAKHAQNIHKLSNPKALLLSDMLLGSVLLSSVLGYEERINLRLQCQDHLTIGTETTFQAETKGYIECNQESLLIQHLETNSPLPQIPIQIRSLRTQRGQQNLVEGITSWPSLCIEDALNEHLKSSYQMNTRLKIKSWFNEKQELCAFGLIYQELPDIPSEVSQRLQEHIDGLTSLPELFQRIEEPDLLAALVIPDETKAVKSINPQFVCSCSLEKMQTALAALPQADIDQLRQEQESLKITCHYCNTTYEV